MDRSTGRRLAGPISVAARQVTSLKPGRLLKLAPQRRTLCLAVPSWCDADSARQAGQSANRGTFDWRMKPQRPAGHNRPRSPLLLIVTNVDWFFLSHRVPIAQAALQHGYDVHVAAADTGRATEVVATGAVFHPLPISRSGTRLLQEGRTIGALSALYRSLRPSILHHVSIKPSLYGTLASNAVPGARIINALSGLGFAVEGNASLSRAVVLGAYRFAFALRRPYVLVQNDEHAQLVTQMKLAPPKRVVTIYGSGVDTSVFVPRHDATPTPASNSPLVVMMTGRMLRDKGVDEFVAAARVIKREVPDVRFVMVGPADDDNPTAVSKQEIESWCAEGAVEWWGRREDMPHVLRQADVYVAPSHHEGLPKALLEAAATGLPLVASDIAGHRPVVTPENGLLVPRADADGLATAIRQVLCLPERDRLRMGRHAREHSQSFAVDKVVDATLALYRRALGDGS